MDLEKEQTQNPTIESTSDIAIIPTKPSEETLGFVYSIVSAICYTISLSSLRVLTNYDEISSDWSIAIKELVTVGCITPFILIQWLRGKYKFPPLKVWFLIILAGITCQVLGARNHLVAYAVLGLALATPLIQATQLVLSSLFGALWLKEKVTKSKIAALAILLVAIWILNQNGQNPSETSAPSTTVASSVESTSELAFDTSIEENVESTVAESPDTPIVEASDVNVTESTVISEPEDKPLRLGFGLFCVLLTALGYSSQLSMMRKALRVGPNDSSTEGPNLYLPTTLGMVLVTGVGLAVCGGCFTHAHGLQGWIVPPWECWRFVLVAGVANMVGFWFQIESLRRLFVLKQTMLANAQTITLVLFGFLFFKEPFTWTMGLGVVMVAAGVAIAGMSK